MKIAIMHNYMDIIGGAEIVTLKLARELKADVYTTNISKSKIIKAGFEDVLPRIKSIGKVKSDTVLRNLKTMFLFYTRRIKNYDLYVIAGDWALSSAIRNKPNIWYCHSPIRELWDLKNTIINSKQGIIRKIVYYAGITVLRKINKKQVKHTNIILCNSLNVQARIYAAFRKTAHVIYPPTNTKNFYYKKNKGYWLAVSRFVEHKRLELLIETFKLIPEKKLIIVGVIENTSHSIKYYNKIKKQKPKNVELLTNVTNKDLIKYYAESTGLITTAYDEDFGLTPVEAMASGKPIVAVDEGGYKETVSSDVGERTSSKPKQMVEAIKRISKNPERYKKACLEKSKKYDDEVFFKKIKKVIKVFKDER